MQATIHKDRLRLQNQEKSTSSKFIILYKFGGILKL